MLEPEGSQTSARREIKTSQDSNVDYRVIALTIWRPGEHADCTARYHHFHILWYVPFQVVGEGSSPFQLLGYYVKFSTDSKRPPLCAVLSETGMQIVCFPYVTDTQASVAAVDCLVLPELPLFFTFTQRHDDDKQPPRCQPVPAGPSLALDQQR